MTRSYKKENIKTLVTFTNNCLFYRNTPKSSDPHLEELMNRNRTIASSAITKAVSGATAGKYKCIWDTGFFLCLLSMINRQLEKHSKCKVVPHNLHLN